MLCPSNTVALYLQQDRYCIRQCYQVVAECDHLGSLCAIGRNTESSGSDNVNDSLDLIQRAPDSSPSPVQHMRIYHRRTHIAVTEELLDRSDIVTFLEQSGREGMSQCVAGRMFGYARWSTAS